MEITRFLKMFRSANTYSCCLFEKLCPVSFVFSKAGDTLRNFHSHYQCWKDLEFIQPTDVSRFFSGSVCTWGSPGSGSLCVRGSPSTVLALCVPEVLQALFWLCVRGSPAHFWLCVCVCDRGSPGLVLALCVLEVLQAWFCVCQRFSRPCFGYVRTWGSPVSDFGSVLHAVPRPSVRSVPTGCVVCELAFLSEWNTSHGPGMFSSGELKQHSKTNVRSQMKSNIRSRKVRLVLSTRAGHPGLTTTDHVQCSYCMSTAMTTSV